MPLSARKFLLFFFLFDIFSMLLLILSPFYCSGDEDEDPPFDATARTSTSRTLVVSEAQPDGDETSPPQQDIEHPTPIASPRAPSPKRARVELAKEPTLPIDSSTTPSMDDVSSLPSFMFRIFQCCRLPSIFASLLLVAVELFNSYIDFSFSTFLLQPLMKEFIRLGTQFVGYRDHAKKLEGTIFTASSAK